MGNIKYRHHGTGSARNILPSAVLMRSSASFTAAAAFSNGVWQAGHKIKTRRPCSHLPLQFSAALDAKSLGAERRHQLHRSRVLVRVCSRHPPSGSAARRSPKARPERSNSMYPAPCLTNGPTPQAFCAE